MFRLLPYLGYCELTAMNIRVQVLSLRPRFQFLWVDTSSGIAGSYASFHFWRNIYTVFHNGCTSLHSHKGSFSPHPHQHLPSLGFFDNRHLNRCEVVAHSGFDLHSLMISDAEHLFVHLLATCMPSLEKVFSGPLPIFKIDCLFPIE